ncbi:DUF2785 domain-containing protein [Alteromonas sp. CYL-A6]|uniref:DUF2785 domain-containing protein n=1 Tax=Alteromonas nitratireducens TaxID=3390813 RepID=UPI0034B5BB01
MHARLLVVPLLFFSASSPGMSLQAQCQAHFPASALSTLNQQTFSADEQQQTARDLLPCLAMADPVIRDNTAFHLLSTWMRAGALQPDTLTAITKELLAHIENNVNDDAGVYLPFAVLTLSEVVRVDRITPYLDKPTLARAGDATARYLSSLTDFRGYDEASGWRHAGAHSADVFLQLALNERTDASMLTTISSALSVVINPSEVHFYRYGEPQRYARAIAYMMLRDTLPVSHWETWLSNTASPAPFESWDAVFFSQRGLAARHNIRAFLLELHHLIADSENARLKSINITLSSLLAALS